MDWSFGNVFEMPVNYHVVLQNNHWLLGLDALFPLLFMEHDATVPLANTPLAEPLG